jgi:hypothetical protein
MGNKVGISIDLTIPSRGRGYQNTIRQRHTLHHLRENLNTHHAFYQLSLYLNSFLDGPRGISTERLHFGSLLRIRTNEVIIWE